MCLLRRIAGVTRYDLAGLKMFFDNAFDSLFGQTAVPETFGVDHHDRAQVAGIQSAGLCNENRIIAHVFRFQALLENLSSFTRPGGVAARTPAEQRMMAVGWN